MLMMKGALAVFLVGTLLPTAFTTGEKRACQGDNGVLKYEVGKSYVYTYGSHAIGGKGLGHNSFTPGITINGSVLLTPLSHCEFIVNLQDTVLVSTTTNSQGKETESNKIKVEASSIKFYMKDGLVDGEIYFHAQDPSWTVNLKKALLHMIQNQAFSPSFQKMEQVESSIFGNCETQYSSESDQRYSKRTNFQECGEGEGSDLISQGVPYQLPLVPNKSIFGFLRPDSHLDCLQEVTDGVISSVECNQKVRHELGMSIVSQLKLKEKRDSTLAPEEAAQLTIPSSVLYNFTKSFSKNMEQNAANKIQQLLLSLEVDGSNRAEVFIDLKKYMARVSSLEQFVGSDHLKEDMHKKAFYDAMVEVTTDEAVHLSAELATQGQFDERTLLNFYMNIAFATSPGTKALEALTKLVKATKVEKVNMVEDSSVEKIEELKTKRTLGQHLLLGASGLAHQYCKLTNAQCSTVPEYQHLVNAIADHVKESEGEEQEVFIGALHALGNLDALTPTAVEAIQKILSKDNSAAVWLEILAMDAFRRDPCQPILKDIVRNTLKDPAKNDQIRIHAYLATSRCLLLEDISAIQTVFAEDSAVGGFIGSHIRNIRDSSSPSKMTLKQSFAQLTLPDNIVAVHNNSRASKFIEYSTFSEKKNVGFSGDATVIFIPGNNKPEFVAFNATLDLFGRSFNFLEVGLSQRLLMKTMMFIGEEVPAEWCCLEDAINAKDSYFRILGTTIGLGLESLNNAMQTSILKSSLGTSPSTLVDMIQPLSYFDEELMFPTISGLPLNMDLQAVRFDSIHMETAGVQNFEDLFNPQAAPVDYKITFLTDFSANLQASLGLGAHTPIHTGYKVDGKFDHKNNFGVQISSKQGTKMDVDLKVTFPNQVIASKDLSLDIYSFEEIEGNLTKLRNAEKGMLVGESLASQPKECFNFYKSLGLKVCSAYRNGQEFPKLYSTSLEKEESGMTGLDVTITSDESEFGKSYEMTMTTPGTITPRVYKVHVNSDQGEMAPGSWDSKEIIASTDLDNTNYTGRIFMNRSEVVGFDGFLTSSNFDITVSYKHANDPETELFNFTTLQPKEHSMEVEAKFGGVLQELGHMKYNFSNEVTEQVITSPINENEMVYITTTGCNAQWKSQLFGNLLFDFKRKCEGWTNSTINATVSVNNRIYDLKQSSSIAYQYRDEKDATQMKRWQLVKERFESHTLLYTHHPNQQLDIQFGNRFTAPGKDEHGRSSNLTLGVTSSLLNQRLQGSASILIVNDFNISSAIVVEQSGTRKFEMSTQHDLENNTHHEIRGKLVGGDVGEFYANLTLRDIHQHFHMDIKCNERGLEIVVDSDLDDNNEEHRTKTDIVVIDKKSKKTIKSECETVVKKAQRTLDTWSKTTDNDKLICSFQMHCELPPDLRNGKSQANMTLEGEHGVIFTGTISETLAERGNNVESNFAMDFQHKQQTPFTYKWDLKVDSDNAHPDIDDMQMRISSDKHFTGEFLAPFDLLIQKDFNFHKKKGQRVYELMSTSNITNTVGQDQFQTNAEMLMTLTGNDSDWKSGYITANGFVAEDLFHNHITGRIDFEEKSHETQIQTATLTVVKTDLQTKSTSTVLDAFVNKTELVHSFMDFEFTENGQVIIQENRTISWVHLVRFYEKELTIFKEVEDSDGNSVSDKLFTLDITAKVFEENHQTKLEMRSRHNFMPHCPTSNVSFTLSK